MKILKTLDSKISKKSGRDQKILMPFVELFIKKGQPIGSNTLKQAGLKDLSSATIRNYFIKLEKEGFLQQAHASSGRTPTEKAYQAYAAYQVTKANDNNTWHFSLNEELDQYEGKEVVYYLKQLIETLSEISKTSVFISAPRFDHDRILHVKLVALDHHRCVCIIVTDFGQINTEVLYTKHKLTTFSVKRLEQYFDFRLQGIDGTEEPKDLSEAELSLAKYFFNEVLVRYIVGYSNFKQEEIYHTGFSKLLCYPDFDTPETLAHGLSIFENPSIIQSISRQCQLNNELSYWIGDQLHTFDKRLKHCTIIAIPYQINQAVSGTLGLLGPLRLPYPKLFSLIQCYADNISKVLTKNIFNHQIIFRKPSEKLYLETKEPLIVNQSHHSFY